MTKNKNYKFKGALFGAFFGLGIWLLLSVIFIFIYGFTNFISLIDKLFETFSGLGKTPLFLLFLFFPIGLFSLVGLALGKIFENKARYKPVTFSITIAISVALLLLVLNSYVIKLLFGEPLRIFINHSQRIDTLVILLSSLAIGWLIGRCFNKKYQ